MRSVWLGGTAFLAMWVLAVGFGIPYFHYHHITISENEIVVGQVEGFLAGSRYAIDRNTGDEALIRSRHVPLYKDDYLSIKYLKKCDCIDSVFKQGHFFVGRMSDGRVYQILKGEVFERASIIPLSQAQSKFDEALATLQDARRQYAHRIPAS